jgi:hypothetical protein
VVLAVERMSIDLTIFRGVLYSNLDYRELGCVTPSTRATKRGRGILISPRDIYFDLIDYLMSLTVRNNIRRKESHKLVSLYL